MSELLVLLNIFYIWYLILYLQVFVCFSQSKYLQQSFFFPLNIVFHTHGKPFHLNTTFLVNFYLLIVRVGLNHLDFLKVVKYLPMVLFFANVAILLFLYFFVMSVANLLISWHVLLLESLMQSSWIVPQGLLHILLIIIIYSVLGIWHISWTLTRKRGPRYSLIDL